VIESYAIHQMAHGTPLATNGSTDSACGTAGPFLLDVGISSSYHIAKFFGLTQARKRIAAARPVETAGAATGTVDFIADAAVEVLPRNDARQANPQGEPGPAWPPRVDIGKTITDALTAAGLMKR
jgi:feruloyl esterase